MTVKLKDVELYYETTGEGHPLLMLHGNGEDHTIFGALAARLSKYFKVYLIDSRNHGRSGKTGECSYREMAEDIVEFIDALGLDRPYVLGFSDGAITAIMAQLASPGLFGRLVLLGPNLHPGDFMDGIYMEMEGKYHLDPDPLLKLMLTQPDIDPLKLYTIHERALVIGGENDIFKPVTFTKITDSLPRGRMRIMYGHDHSSYVIGSDVLFKPVRDFLLV